MGVAITARAREAFGLARSAGLDPWPLMARARKEVEAVKIKVTIELSEEAASVDARHLPLGATEANIRRVVADSRRTEEVSLPYTAPRFFRIVEVVGVVEAPAGAGGGS